MLKEVEVKVPVKFEVLKTIEKPKEVCLFVRMIRIALECRPLTSVHLKDFYLSEVSKDNSPHMKVSSCTPHA